MKGNKIKGTLLIAVFILSTLAMAIPLAIAAPLTIVLSTNTGNVGDTIKISGTANTSVPIDIFWDYIKIAETSADGAGDYSKNITIPKDVVGVHVIAVKDTFHGFLAEKNFDIDPKITVTPESGLPLDTFTVAGTGFAAESDIELLFISTNYTLTKADDGIAEWVTTPAIGEYSVKLYAPDHASNGWSKITLPMDMAFADLDDVSVYVEGLGSEQALPMIGIELDESTLPDDVDLTGGNNNPGGENEDLTGYTRVVVSSQPGQSEDLSDTLVTDAEEGFELYGTHGTPDIDLGTGKYWTIQTESGFFDYFTWDEIQSIFSGATFTEVAVQLVWPQLDGGEGGDFLPVASTVYIDDITINDVTYDFEPEEETDVLGSFEATLTVPAGIEYAVYPVTAIDASGNYNTTDFEVTATIDMTPDEGASGTVVDISGIGFNGTKVEIFFDGVSLKKDVAITDGIFTDDFIVPTIAIDEYPVIAIDEDGIEAYLKFNVTETTQITLDPTSTEPDTLVTIEGTGFTATVGVEVDVDVGPLMDYYTFVTNSTGGFKETLQVPTFIPGSYVINATDENGLTAVADLNIAITELTLDPEEGPTGIEIEVNGTGFTPDALFNVTFNNEIVITNAGIDTYGDLSDTFTVPTVPVGFYTVKVVDDLEISGTATFEVNATTTITVTPSAALVGYTIELEGAHFSADSAVTVVLQNSTWSETLTTEPTSFDTETNGTFACTFDVPEVDLGNYFVNATDANDLVALVPFTVVESIYVDVSTSSPEYLPGDTVSFQVIAAFAFDIQLVIKDSTGYPFTTIGPIVIADWVVMGDYYVVPYADATFELPSDANEGLWNYTAYDDTEKVDTGTFAVGEAVEPQPDLPAETTGEEPLDSTGAPKTSFTLGEMVLASAEVTNAGTESQSMLIAVQWMDPDYRTLAPVFMITTLSPGQSFVYAPGLILPTTGYATGTWTATILVFDTWPALGGVTIGAPVTITITVS